MSKKQIIMLTLMVIISGILSSYVPRVKNMWAIAAYPFFYTYRCAIEPLVRLKKEWQILRSERNEFAQLRAYNKLLLAENIILHAQLQTYNDIKELVEFNKRYSYEHSYCSQILVRNTTLDDQTCFITGGTSHGIAVDMPVVYMHSLIGRVIEVYQWYCKVRLITSKQSKIAIYTEQTQLSGICEGVDKAHQCQLSYIPHVKQPRIGERLITSGDGLVCPRGFGVGVIKQAYVDGLYYIILVEPLININEITHCMILKQPI